MNAKPETAAYRRAFDAAPENGLAERRSAALQRFETLGFPTRRDEAWRFTDLRPLQQHAFPPAPAGAAPIDAAVPARLARAAFGGTAHRLTFVNGRFAPQLSHMDALPAGALLASSAEVVIQHPELAQRLLDQTDLAGGQAFSALNAALFGDGFVLALAPGLVLDRPVEIVHWGAAAERSFHLRDIVLLGTGSRATLVETFIGEGRYWTNAVAILDLGAGATLRHVKLQDESADAIHVGQARAALAREARYESFVLTLGGRLARHDSFVKLDGEGAACGLFGAYLLRGEQEATNATVVDHAAPGCTTSEVFKGVVDERAHGVFLGRIAVRPDAQKTDAHQLNKNLLLSARASVDTKPELEILADDVKCSHGATVGDLDADALFYLEARGIPAAEARRMLIEAFAADAIEQFAGDPALRAHLGAQVERWLRRTEEAGA